MADTGLTRLIRDVEDHVTSHCDAAGHITRWVYDGLPYPVHRLNADGSGLLYRYDEKERRGDLAIRHRHDAWGCRTATELPDGRLIETADDAQDEVLVIG